ncbi:NIPSNAP family protein [Mucilaginibacter angelicae]|uniref:NIPSNAP family protein n=1 Tax=Mucilaginibacter angelicae TaxID=869718 RepID=A0ABV6L1H5_9SPHI
MTLYNPFRFVCFCLLLTVIFSSNVRANAPALNYYQLKIYHYKNAAQETRIEQYLQQAYVPAIHRAGIKNVGVFKPVTQQDTDRKIYVFTPFSSLDKLAGIEQRLQADTKYQADGKDYIDADYKNSPYSRIETIVLQAFPGMPSTAIPDLTAAKADRVYELRSYESATEKYNINKVRMFNTGDEIGLFKRLGFNAVFYSEVIAGSHMPNLMYMTTFNNKADRDKHWDAFGNDAQWKALTANEEYKNNVSHADIIFLHPAEYSDF